MDKEHIHGTQQYLAYLSTFVGFAPVQAVPIIQILLFPMLRAHEWQLTWYGIPLHTYTYTIRFSMSKNIPTIVCGLRPT